MTKFLKMSVLSALGVASVCLSGAANAATVIPCPGGTIVQGCSFDAAVDTGSFYDRIIFTGSPTAFDDIFKVVLDTAGDVTITLTSSPTGINFTSLLFDGTPFSFGTGGTTITRGPGTFDLQVAGFVTKNASFAGTIDFASAIPEPATWAMMISGFGLLGGALRRQRRSALRGATAAA